MLAKVEDRHDGRMIHLGNELSLAFKALFSLGAKQCWWNELDGHLALEVGVECAIHRPHSAGGNGHEQLELAEPQGHHDGKTALGARDRRKWRKLARNEINKIAGEVATANLISSIVSSVISEPAMDSEGRDALRITIVIAPGAAARNYG